MGYKCEKCGSTSEEAGDCCGAPRKEEAAPAEGGEAPSGDSQ